MTKPTKWVCAQQRLRSAWASAQFDQSSLCAQWVAKDPRFLHEDSEDSDQTGRMPRLIWVFAGRTLILLVLSCHGSYLISFHHLEDIRCNKWRNRTNVMCAKPSILSLRSVRMKTKMSPSNSIYNQRTLKCTTRYRHSNTTNHGQITQKLKEQVFILVYDTHFDKLSSPGKFH